jgi:predicted acetyltransferase
MAGVHSVSVVPDRRGQGLARAVMTPLLHAVREHGDLISSLFPAMTRLYRGLGWEMAGSYLWRGVAPRTLQLLARPVGVTLRPGGVADLPALQDCYTGFAAPQNGQLDRTPAWWQRLAALWDERNVFVVEAPEGDLQGYVVYRQLDGEWSALGGPFRIAVYELVATTQDAALALWRLLGSWASQATQIVYRGPAEDPLLLLLPEQELAVLAEIRWMTRVLDAAGAVAARGFAAGLDLEVAFELHDPVFSHNQGRFVLRVRDGRGQLERGGSGGPALPIGAFSSLYTGWASAATLRRAGRLVGGSPAQCAALDAAFAGQTPWMLDEF